MSDTTIFIQTLTASIQELNDYLFTLENTPGVIISQHVTSINDLLKTGVSEGMEAHLNGRKGFFNGGGAQVWVASEILRTSTELTTLSATLSSVENQ